MGREFVSVVIPTFNRAYCVAKTVDTALAQTHRDLEVVLVDDGSTDGTEQLISERYGTVRIGSARPLYPPDQRGRLRRPQQRVREYAGGLRRPARLR